MKRIRLPTNSPRAVPPDGRRFATLAPCTRQALQRRAVLLSLLLLGSALLQPAALAGNEPPLAPPAAPGSAFIRVFNATAQGGVDARVGNTGLGSIAPFSASEFVALAPGRQTLAIGPANQTTALLSDRFYTAVLANGSIQMHDNERFKNQVKSMIVLFNLTDLSPLNLRTGDGRPVVDDVGAKASATREVNAATTDLALYKGGEKLTDVKPISMERGRAYSLFVAVSGDQPIAVWVVN